MKRNFTSLFIFLMLVTGLMARGSQLKYGPDAGLQDALSELRNPEAAALAGRFIATERLFTAAAAQQKSTAATMKLDSITYQDYLAPAKSWEFSWRDIYLYDAQNRLYEILEKEWDAESNSMIVEWRTTIAYNAQGRISEIVDYTIDEGEMKMSSRMECFWNNAGRIDSIVDYSEGWDSGEMELSGYQKYFYDGNGRVTHISSYDYDDELEAYAEMMRRKFTFNEAGRRIMTQMLIIDEEEEEEFVFSQTEFFYNAAGKLTASEYSGFNFATFQLEKRSRSEYDYDSDGDQTASRWLDRVEEAWVLEDRDVISYHPTLKAAGVIFPFAVMTSLYEYDTNIDYNFLKLPMGSTSYEFQDGVESIDSRSLFHYTGLSNTLVGETVQTGFKLYPNPVAGQLHLGFDSSYDQLTLEVYHITGARVMQQYISANQAVDTETLRTGMYLYRLSNNGQVVYSGRFIKQ